MQYLRKNALIEKYIFHKNTIFVYLCVRAPTFVHMYITCWYKHAIYIDYQSLPYIVKMITLNLFFSLFVSPPHKKKYITIHVP